MRTSITALSVSLAILLLTTSQQATASELHLEQVGENHHFEHQGEGANNTLTIYQVGDDHTLRSEVNGTGNRLYIDQVGTNNSTDLTVSGQHNDISVYQGQSSINDTLGSDNTVQISVDGNGNDIETHQSLGNRFSTKNSIEAMVSGNENRLFINQRWDLKNAYVNITGNDNYATAWQEDGEVSLVISGSDNTATLTDLLSAHFDVAINGQQNVLNATVTNHSTDELILRQDGIGNNLDVNLRYTDLHSTQNGNQNEIRATIEYGDITTNQLGNANQLQINSDIGNHTATHQQGNQNRMNLMFKNSSIFTGNTRAERNFEQIGNNNQMDYWGSIDPVSLSQNGNENTMHINNAAGQFTNITASQVGNGHVVLVNQ